MLSESDAKMVLDVIVGQCRVAHDLSSAMEVDGLIETYRRAIEHGPILLPSEWRIGHEMAEQILELLLAWRTFVRAVEDPLAAVKRQLDARIAVATARAKREPPRERRSIGDEVEVRAQDYKGSGHVVEVIENDHGLAYRIACFDVEVDLATGLCTELVFGWAVVWGKGETIPGEA